MAISTMGLIRADPTKGVRNSKSRLNSPRNTAHLTRKPPSLSESSFGLFLHSRSAPVDGVNSYVIFNDGFQSTWSFDCGRASSTAWGLSKTPPFRTCPISLQISRNLVTVIGESIADNVADIPVEIDIELEGGRSREPFGNYVPLYNNARGKAPHSHCAEPRDGGGRSAGASNRKDLSLPQNPSGEGESSKAGGANNNNNNNNNNISGNGNGNSNGRSNGRRASKRAGQRRELACPLCRLGISADRNQWKKFPYISRLLTHINTDHKKYPCPGHKQDFPDMSVLITHQSENGSDICKSGYTPLRMKAIYNIYKIDSDADYQDAWMYKNPDEDESGHAGHSIANHSPEPRAQAANLPSQNSQQQHPAADSLSNQNLVETEIAPERGLDDLNGQQPQNQGPPLQDSQGGHNFTATGLSQAVGAETSLGGMGNEYPFADLVWFLQDQVNSMRQKVDRVDSLQQKVDSLEKEINTLKEPRTEIPEMKRKLSDVQNAFFGLSGFSGLSRDASDAQSHYLNPPTVEDSGFGTGPGSFQLGSVAHMNHTRASTQSHMPPGGSPADDPGAAHIPGSREAIPHAPYNFPGAVAQPFARGLQPSDGQFGMMYNPTGMGATAPAALHGPQSQQPQATYPMYESQAALLRDVFGRAASQ